MGQLPALTINPRNALIDYSPINDAIDGNRRHSLQLAENKRQEDELTMRKDQVTYQRGRDSKNDAWQQVERGGKMAMAIQNMRDDDPAKAAAWQRYLKTFGDGNHSPEEMDFRTGPKLAAAAAGQFLDPRESRMKDLEIQQKQAQINALNRRESGSKLMEVNGRIVRIPESGPAQEVYAAPSGSDVAAMTKGAPSGYTWNDPQNPRAGVSPIPGVEKPIPGEVAGKVAMMNMARKGIDQTRGAFERDWGAGDVAKYGAANIPLVGDFSPASGDIGIAQRNIRVGIEAALRTMTGAAAPEQEVRRYMAMFAPGANDTKESAKQKLDGLMNFMNQAETLVLQGRGQVELPQLQGGAEQPAQAKQPTGAVQPKSAAEYQSLPSGTVYVDPEGIQRVKK